MTAINAPRDQNSIPALMATSNADGKTAIPVFADSVTNGLIISGTITATNPSVSATGAAVPASGTYIGINVAGNLRGQTGVNPSGSVYAAQIDIASVAGATVATAASGIIKVGLTDGSGTAITSTGAALDVNLKTSGVSNLSTNVAQINGVAPLMGNGTTGTGSLRVTIASDNTAFSVNATLSAETTKVIGVVRTADGSGNLLTSTGQALDVNIKTSGASNISTNVAQINGVTPLMGNGVSGTGSLRVNVATDTGAIANWGHGATGAAVPAGAVYQGFLAKTALPSAGSDGNTVGGMADKFGRQVTLPFGIRDTQSIASVTISNSTTETLLMGSVSAVFSDITSLIIANTATTSGSVTRVDIKDGWGGVVKATFEIPNNDTRGITYTFPLIQGSSNTAWTATCSVAITDIRLTIQVQQNK